MTWLRLLTCFPDRPLRSLPRFISCMVFFTLRPADLLYLRAMDALRGVLCDGDHGQREHTVGKRRIGL
jgi:hypothetical protein